MNALLGFGATMLAPKLMSGLTDQKVKVVHASPGRVRLQCDKWKNEPTARNLRAVFAGIPIVKDAQSSPVTGSLLLIFHVPTLTEEQFDALVKLAVETSVSTFRELPSSLDTVLQNSVNTVDVTLKKQSGGHVDLDALLSIGLMIGGINTLPLNPAFGSSMLYWAYSLIKKHNA